MEFRAEMRYLRVSPQKARLVLDLIKGRRVEDARNTLMFTKKRVAAHGGQAAAVGAGQRQLSTSEKGIDVEIDNLYVKRAIANDGPRMKRIRPAPQGRAYRYQRRIAHIELVLAERGKNGEAVATVVGGESCGSGEGKETGSGGEEGCGKEKSSGEMTAGRLSPRFARVRNDKGLAGGREFRFRESRLTRLI